MMDGQITIDEYIKSISLPLMAGCSDCICWKCLYFWSARCPYGKCWDDHRAKEDPYDRAHPDEPPRTLWSNWHKPGEQAHWCRGGTFYPVSYCPHFVKYLGEKIQRCLLANVQVFQDGYILCDIIGSIGCEECYRRFNDESD